MSNLRSQSTSSRDLSTRQVRAQLAVGAPMPTSSALSESHPLRRPGLGPADRLSGRLGATNSRISFGRACSRPARPARSVAKTSRKRGGTRHDVANDCRPIQRSVTLDRLCRTPGERLPIARAANDDTGAAPRAASGVGSRLGGVHVWFVHVWSVPVSSFLFRSPQVLRSAGWQQKS